MKRVDEIIERLHAVTREELENKTYLLVEAARFYSRFEPDKGHTCDECIFNEGQGAVFTYLDSNGNPRPGKYRCTSDHHCFDALAIWAMEEIKEGGEE